MASDPSAGATRTATTTTAPSSSTGPHILLTARTLRDLTLLAFLPTFALLLPHGIITGEPFPAVTLVAMAGSCVLTLGLRMTRTRDGQIALSPTAADRPDGGVVVAFVAEALLAALYLGLLVPSWLAMAAHTRWGRPVWAAYGTVPVVMNFAIHLSLLAVQAPGVLGGHVRRARAWYVEQQHAGACAHCGCGRGGFLGVGPPACQTGTFPVDQKVRMEENGGATAAAAGENRRDSQLRPSEGNVTPATEAAADAVGRMV